MEQDLFDKTLEKTFCEMVEDLREYESFERQSDFIPFGREDILEAVVKILAGKIRSDENMGRDESLLKADEIVSNLEEEISEPLIKKRICSMLETLTGDLLNILPVIFTELIKTGAINVPLDPTGALLASAACLIVLRTGVANFCSA